MNEERERERSPFDTGFLVTLRSASKPGSLPLSIQSSNNNFVRIFFLILLMELDGAITID